MIDNLVLFYASHQNIISVMFMLAPIGALMFQYRRRGRHLTGRDIFSAGAHGAALNLGLLLVFAASASEAAEAKINFPAEIAILGGIAVVYACRGLAELWNVPPKDDNDN